MEHSYVDVLRKMIRYSAAVESEKRKKHSFYQRDKKLVRKLINVKKVVTEILPLSTTVNYTHTSLSDCYRLLIIDLLCC